jgi:hypothetical protein
MVAAMLTPLFRYGEPRANAPFFLVRSSQAGTGKTLLVDTIALSVVGEAAAACSLSQDRMGDESQKRVNAILRRGRAIVKIDNVPSGTSFGGSPWDELTTGGGRYEGRELGTENQATLDNLSTWFLTGNNVQLTADSYRRVLWVELEASSADPENRSDFRHEKITEYALEKRHQTLACLLVVQKAWDQARARGERVDVRRFGSFEQWQCAVGAAVVFAGLDDPATTRKGASDTDEGSMTVSVLEALAAFCDAFSYPDGCRASALCEEVNYEEAPTKGDARRELRAAWLCMFDEKGLTPRKIGDWLKRNQNVLRENDVGDQLQLVSNRKDRKGFALWCVVRTAKQAKLPV